MAKLELIGAVGVKVRPDARGFRRDTKNEVERELKTYKPSLTVKGDVEFDRAKAKAEIRELEEMARKAKASVEVKFDAGRSRQVTDFIKNLQGSYEGLSAAQKKAVQDRMRFAGFEERATQKAIDGLKNWKQQTRSMVAVNKQFKESLESSGFVEIQKLADKLAGSNKQLSQMSRIVGTDLNNAFEKLNGQWSRFSRTQRETLQDIVQADDNARIATAADELRKVNDQIDRLNEAKRRDSQAMYDSMFGNFKDNLTGVLKDDPWYQWSLGPKLSEDALIRAERDAKNVKDKYDEALKNIKAKIEAEPTGLGVVAAQMRYVARPRTANIFVKINQRSLAAAEGSLKSLAGMNVLTDASRLIESVLNNFDTLTVKTGALSAGIGSIIDTLAYATSSFLSIGEGMFNVVGLLATAPTMLAGATAAVVITTAAFQDFKKAIDGDKKALDGLPPAARNAALALRGTWESLQQPVQAAFWEGMGDSIQLFVADTLPELRRGLTATAPHVAGFMRGFLDSLRGVANSGDMGTMFENLATGFDNANAAAKPFADALSTLGLRGSEFLPKFGTWISNLAIRFDDWIDKASRTGEITRWIEQGTKSMQDMWAVGGDVVDIFRAMTRAANDGGAGGLDGFHASLRHIADLMLAEPFQTRMSTIFDGARTGAHQLNIGVKNVGETLGKSAGWLSRMLQLSGDLGGALLTDVAKVIGGIKFQEGTLKGVEGMRDAIKDMGPAARDLGDVFGALSGVAGSTIRGLAPLINSVMGVLADSVNSVSENLEALGPKLTFFITSRVEGLGGPVRAVFESVDALLGVFNALPGPVGQAVIAIGAFLMLKNAIGGVFAKFDQGPLFSKLRGQWMEQGALAGKTVDQMGKFSGTSVLFRNAATSAGVFSTQLRTLNEQAKVDGMSALRANVNTTATVMRTGLTSAARGLMGVLGGPWGVALVGASVALGAFGAAQAESKQRVDALTASMDAQTGEATAQSLGLIAKSWTDLDKAADSMANLTRGSKAANETASLLGLNFANVTKSIASGGAEYDRLRDRLVGLKDALTLRADYGGFDKGTVKVHEFEEQLGLAVGSLDNLNKKDVGHLLENLEKGRNEAALSQAVYEGLGKATGTTAESAQHMASAMATIGDTSLDAASKIGAIRKALDLLKNGGKLSMRDAEIAAADAQRLAVQSAETMRESLAVAGDSIFDTNGLLAKTSAVGMDLRKSMRNAADGILIEAQAAYDAARLASKSPQEASDAALKVVEANNDRLNEIAKAAGVAPEKLHAEWDTFFGKDWELRATFSAHAQKFQEVMKSVQDAGYEFDGQEFAAWLLAQPDPAKVSIEDATNHALRYAQGRYAANLQALPDEARAAISQLTGTTEEQWNRGDFTAVMRAAKDVPGLADALQAILNVKNGDYTAAIKSFADAYTAAQTKAALDALAAPRTMGVFAKLAGVDSGLSKFGPLAGGYAYPDSANGNMFFNVGGSNPRVKHFANGGIENHYAQIARPQSGHVRVWAEPETGGESYIPHAASKRARSIAIWKETGRILGQNVDAFADGGVSVGGNSKARSGGGGMNIVIDTFNQHSTNTVDDVGRGIMRQARRAGALSVSEFL